MTDTEERASEPAPRATTTPAQRTLPWRSITLGLLVAALALSALLWTLRSALVTALLTDALTERGVQCDALEVTASATLSRLEIAPTRCEVADGPVASASWREPIEVLLEGGDVSSVRVRTLSISRRGAAAPAVSGAPSLSGTLATWTEAPARVGGVVRFASRLSETDSPAISVQRVEIAREGQRGLELELEGLEAPARAAGSPATLSIAELALASAEGPAGLSAVPRLHAVVVEADRAHGSLEGTLDATLRLPSLGGLSLGTLQLGAIAGEQRVRVEADGLDGAEPHYAVTMSR